MLEKMKGTQHLCSDKTSTDEVRRTIAIANTMICGGSGSRIQIAAKGIIQDVDKEYFAILGHIIEGHVIWRKELLVFQCVSD
ncbi:hypothetical protein FRX31_007639 [Thalictrum thalictroides]|uniref:Uncharacterized protein n=1 Tax=Thalictrum thalictroides TaxID=46969 RepID=A0A7J6WZC7_THATH|nr:hypothetical protein FRX31_007639 [Thalictrum thalictroides]